MKEKAQNLTPILLKVTKFSSGRLHIEVPRQLVGQIKAGDHVWIEKIELPSLEAKSSVKNIEVI